MSLVNYNTSTANLFSGVSCADIRNEKFSFDKKISFGDRFGTTSRESTYPKRIRIQIRNTHNKYY
jgi:hypothetical protein